MPRTEARAADIERLRGRVAVAARGALRRAHAVAGRAGGAARRPAGHARLHRAPLHATSSRSTATGGSPTTRPSCAARRPFHGAAGARRGAPEGPQHEGEDRPRTSATRGPRATARRCARCAWPRSSAGRSSSSSTRRRRIPGIESEERGVAEAIALNLREMAVLDVPVIVAVCGEGGSGGALGIADRRPRAHAAVRDLQRHPAGGVLRDSLARLEPEGGRRGGAEAHGARTCSGRDRRRHRARAARRAHTRTRRGAARPGRGDRRARWPRCRRHAGRRRGSSSRYAEVPQHGPPRHRLRRTRRRRPSARAGRRGPRADGAYVWDHLACDDEAAGDAGAELRRRPRRRAPAGAARHHGRRRGAAASSTRRLDQLHDPFLLAGMDRAVDRLLPAVAAARAHRRARRLRRRRHHGHGHRAPDARDARRRRRALRARADARRLRPQHAGDRTAARRGRARHRVGRLRNPRRGRRAAGARAGRRPRSSPTTTSPTRSCRRRWRSSTRSARTARIPTSTWPASAWR